MIPWGGSTRHWMPSNLRRAPRRVPAPYIRGQLDVWGWVFLMSESRGLKRAGRDATVRELMQTRAKVVELNEPPRVHRRPAGLSLRGSVGAS